MYKENIDPHKKGDIVYIPITPGGAPCTWLQSNSEKRAWKKLLIDTAHMPYKTNKNFKKRGYTVGKAVIT